MLARVGRVFLTICTVVGAVVFFHFIFVTQIFPFHQSVLDHQVKHPELLPSQNVAKLASVGHVLSMSDTYWLSTIQYIGSSAASSAYKQYLYRLLDLITDLDPEFDSPYHLGQILLSSTNARIQSDPKEDRITFEQADILGKKGFRHFCNAQKVQAIIQETDLLRLWKRTDLANPCGTRSSIPYYLGYNAYWNLKDPKSALIYYKVASLHDDSQGAKIMAAIMAGKAGERNVSAIMFLSLAELFSEGKNKQCAVISQELKNILLAFIQKNTPLTGDLVEKIENVRKKTVQALGEDGIDVGKGIFDDMCSTNLNKAVREVNLAYLDAGLQRCKERYKQSGFFLDEMKTKGCISYIPQDFQRNESEGTEMSYYYNNDLNQWDYHLTRILKAK